MSIKEKEKVMTQSILAMLVTLSGLLVLSTGSPVYLVPMLTAFVCWVFVIGVEVLDLVRETKEIER